MRILRGQYQLMQLYIRAGFSSPAQAPFFLICAGDSVGAGYRPCVMPRPELTCHFKIDRNLMNFDPSTWAALKIFLLMCSFWAKYIFELKKSRGGIFHETEEGYKIWRGIDLLFQNWHKEFDKFDLSTQNSQRFSL